MTGGIYRSEFEAMKAPHIMRKRVSYYTPSELKVVGAFYLISRN